MKSVVILMVLGENGKTKRMDLFRDLNFDDINDTYAEQAVREEIIFPLLHELGYRSHGENTIDRNVRLLNPYSRMGTKRRKINIYPDYLLRINGYPVFIIDAKSSKQNIEVGKHVEQAFSYATHPEVQVQKFVLCNGKELIIFDTQPSIIFRVSIREISQQWPKIVDLIGPVAFKYPGLVHTRFDFGNYIMKQGYLKQYKHFYFYLPLLKIALIRRNPDVYSIQTKINHPTEPFYAHFDFNKKSLQHFLSYIQPDKASLINNCLNKPYFFAEFQSENIMFCLKAEFGGHVEGDPSRHIILHPFKVKKFITANELTILEGKKTRNTMFIKPNFFQLASENSPL